MYVELPPERDLAGRVACVWRQVAEADFTQLVVPDACVDLIWGPDGPFVAGPDTGPMPTAMRAGDTFDGIRFRPGAVGDFFGLPLDELRDQRVPLAALPFPVADPPGVPPFAAAGSPGAPPFPAADGPSPPVAIPAPIRELLVRSARVDPAAPAIAAALRKGRSVGEVAWDLGLSERQLQRRSLASFGYAPKTLQRIVRFQRALRLARAGVPLAEVAVTAGYADQAHLSHDVKRLSGVPMHRLVSPAGELA
ncbi:helix-turn-helix transcriptional regulator [Nonomuraea jiangxiensis]|uniref:AraC-type DNA-binding protein n=1 Tax=Nonomuraea jiangxiensis TaxID=633440 RepID=A0A1G9SDE6_9ACTN|nr:helix-turn-helix transcriptional regulator [Nonomuraea jiangxiensis]SDM32815.1 AraC-type DNA-binding protein [Nonomuraea jiangxiensis]